MKWRQYLNHRFFIVKKRVLRGRTYEVGPVNNYRNRTRERLKISRNIGLFQGFATTSQCDNFIGAVRTTISFYSKYEKWDGTSVSDEFIASIYNKYRADITVRGINDDHKRKSEISKSAHHIRRRLHEVLIYNGSASGNYKSVNSTASNANLVKATSELYEIIGAYQKLLQRWVVEDVPIGRPVKYHIIMIVRRCTKIYELLSRKEFKSSLKLNGEGKKSFESYKAQFIL